MMIYSSVFNLQRFFIEHELLIHEVQERSAIYFQNLDIFLKNN